MCVDLGAYGEVGGAQSACSDIRAISETMCVQFQRSPGSRGPGIRVKLGGTQAGFCVFQ